MSERQQVYRCLQCNSMVAVARGGSGILSCCEAPMALHVDISLETHEIEPAPTMEHNLSLSAKAVLRLVQTRVAEYTSYFGVKTLKNPMDFWVYQEIIWDLKPDVVVEIGNAFGGSTLALAHLLDHIGNGRLLAVDQKHDIYADVARNHPRVQTITSDACAAIDVVRASIVPGESVLVIEDSLHTYENTLNVLRTYGPLVTPGSMFIVEDTHLWHGLDYGPQPGPYDAVADFLAESKDFVSDRSFESFFITFNPTGYLRCVRS